ncbi:DUF4214 domain-containing protein [Duganella fentianensis]|uniref:DUF4214 domain-containing protein n=1 Tax=Duganella fentianensis TaxID=2692177 RepID=UPI0032B2240F
MGDILVDDYWGNERTSGKLALGQTVQGDLRRDYDQDWFAVQLEAGLTYYLNGTTDIATNGMQIGFYDPLKAQTVALAGIDAAHFGLEFTPTHSGTYYAMAIESGEGHPARHYTLQLDYRTAPDDFLSSSQTSGVVKVDQHTQGRFEQHGDVDWFKFHAEVGMRYDVVLDTPAAGAADVGWLRSFKYVDATGATLSRGSGGFNPQSSGDYYLAFTGAEVGNYGLVLRQWRDEFPQSYATSGKLSAQAPVSSSVDFEGDCDWFRVDVEKGKIYIFTMYAEQGYPLQLMLFGDQYQPLAIVDGYQSEAGLQLTYQATESRALYIQAARQPASSNITVVTPYTLKMEVQVDEVSDTPLTAHALAIGEAGRAAIQITSDVDVFKFTLVAGTSYDFVLAASSANSSYQLEFATYRDNAVLASELVGSAGKLSYTPVTSGDYWVRVSSAGWVAPQISYSLTGQLAADDWGATPATAAILALDQTLAARLESATDRDWFAVNLVAGNTYWFETPGNGVYSVLRILDQAQGSQSASTQGPLAYTPAQSGTYYLEVSALPGWSGNYNVRYSVGPHDDVGDSMSSASGLALSIAKRGQLELSTDRDVFRFEVEAGQIYQFNLQHNAGTFVVADLSDAAGTALSGVIKGSAYPDDTQVFVAGRSGTVYASVHGTAAASYQVQLQAISDDAPNDAGANVRLLAEGASLTGQLEYAGDRDVYAIELDASLVYVFKLASNQPGGAVPSLKTTASPGHSSASLIENTVSDGVRTIKVQASSAGQYFLEVGPVWTSLGGYQLSSLVHGDDGAGPRLVAQSMPDHASNVLLTSRAIVLKFSEAIIADTSALTIKDSAGKVVLQDFLYPQVQGDTLTVHTLHNLAPGDYTLSLPAVAIHDKDGNRYKGPETISFSTKPAMLQPGTGNDVYVMTPDAIIDGGSGVDTIFIPSFSTFTYLSRDGAGYYITDQGHGTHAYMRNIERVVMLGGEVYALDVDGVAGQAYRLYQAAFNRSPDLGGLGFWIEQMDAGTSLNRVAKAFVESGEFTSLYGKASTDAFFVDTLYQNVLHRAADADGRDFWIHALQNNVSRAEVLAHFSESAENQQALAEIIGSGFYYQPTLAG